MSFLFLKSQKELEDEKKQRILYEDDLREITKNEVVAKRKRTRACKTLKSKRQKAKKSKN